ncbi:(2Fe-2S)-binding protein [Streptomyces sp. NPDC050804]|uniref:(2Fe-2S)-binding protein n=1 Tax=Streptomyces sp. NPDC050804 TaxID=3154745 RepID=UPI003432844E
MYVCSCFGITETEVKAHADAGACTPRQIASASKAGTDCGSCVRRIQSILGRGGCPRRELLDRRTPVLVEPADPEVTAVPTTLAPAPAPAPVSARLRKAA